MRPCEKGGDQQKRESDGGLGSEAVVVESFKTFKQEKGGVT